MKSVVLPSLPNIQQTLRIDATPSLPFTLEATTNLSDPNSWQPLLTTNAATMPFDFVDFDVKTGDDAEVLPRPPAVAQIQVAKHSGTGTLKP